MSKTRQQKGEDLKELIEAVKNAKGIAFSQYAGTSVAQITKLRRQARQANVRINVAKKTLVRIAAKENGYDEIPEDITPGQVLVAFGQDEVSAAKILKTLGKEIETIKLIGGLFEGKVLGEKAIRELADIPSKEELYAKLMGMFQSPLRNFASTISSPLSSFARAMNSYAEKKH